MEYYALINYTVSPAGPVLVSASGGNKLHPELPDRTFLTSRADGVETYVIPGSSLKGVMRHYLYKHNPEAVVDGLFGFCGQKNSRKSLVSVSDAFADMDTVVSAVRYSTMVGSVSQSALNGSLNQSEAVIKGDFKGSIKLKKVSAFQLAMILNALNAINSSDICVGGKISRGFGRMKVTGFEMTVSDGFNADLTPRVTGRYTSVDEALSDIMK